MIPPQLHNYRPWSSPEIACGTGKSLLMIWFFVVIWCGISFPMSWQLLHQFQREGDPTLLVALVFPGAGLLMLGWAVHQTLGWRRFGSTVFRMDPYPGAIGGQVGGTIDLNLPYDANHRFNVSLQCVHSVMTGSGKNRRRSERPVWQSRGLARARLHARGTRLSILFDVDAGLPASEQPATRYHLWRLVVEAALPGVDFKRTYELPVFATGAQVEAPGR